MIVDEDREVQLFSRAAACLVQGPIHQGLSNTCSVVGLEDVKLVEQHSGAIRLDRELHRSELHVADGFAVRFRDAERISSIAELRLPISDPETRQKCVEVLGPIQVAERAGEDGTEYAVERGSVLHAGVAVGDRHSNPAGVGQSGEWIAITLNSSPIASPVVSRFRAALMSSARAGLRRDSVAARASIPSRRSHSHWGESRVTSAPAPRTAFTTASKS